MERDHSIVQPLGVWVHDTVVVGLAYREESEVVLDLAMRGEYRTRLVVHRPRAVGLAGFVNGSIVLDVESYDLGGELPDPESPIWSVLNPWWPVDALSRSQLIERFIASERLRGGVLVSVECSYGGDLAFIGDSLTGHTRRWADPVFA